MTGNKNATKVICTAIALLLSSGIAFSNAFASGAETAAHEVVEHTTADMTKEAASEVADDATEKAIGLAKEHAHGAVDTTLEKVDETLMPAEEAAGAVKEASH
ncbi:MAG: hypothetical protein KKH60_08410 [Proteobacteria bacterium]|nr:hypothetical protein [Pseudomonadota bacterium]MBU1140595.1 hypothetical protein [Pseudomonadota bacterium]